MSDALRRSRVGVFAGTGLAGALGLVWLATSPFQPPEWEAQAALAGARALEDRDDLGAVVVAYREALKLGPTDEARIPALSAVILSVCTLPLIRLNKPSSVAQRLVNSRAPKGVVATCASEFSAIDWRSSSDKCPGREDPRFAGNISRNRFHRSKMLSGDTSASISPADSNGRSTGMIAGNAK